MKEADELFNELVRPLAEPRSDLKPSRRVTFGQAATYINGHIACTACGQVPGREHAVGCAYRSEENES